MSLLHPACVAFGAIAIASAAYGAEPTAYLQPNISSASVTETPRGYTVDVRILASDLEEMFLKSRAERRGVDLSSPGILELEIGRFFAKRIVLRNLDGSLCNSKVERAGEDPANDEGVRVTLAFECAGRDVVYDAASFLTTQGARSWQVVTIVHGDAHRQIMVNAESPPAPLNPPG